MLLAIWRASDCDAGIDAQVVNDVDGPLAIDAIGVLLSRAADEAAHFVRSLLPQLASGVPVAVVGRRNVVSAGRNTWYEVVTVVEVLVGRDTVGKSEIACAGLTEDDCPDRRSAELAGEVGMVERGNSVAMTRSA